MKQQKYISYFRVSTQRQGASGLGLEAQEAAVKAYLGTTALIAVFTEIESGKRNDRPKLAEALRLCRQHGATLIIAKLDRLARNVAFISSLMESGVEFVATDFPQANRLTLHILSAVAEHEAKAISDRTTSALKAAKARGTKLGGWRGEETQKRAQEASLAVRRDKAAAKAVTVSDAIKAMRADGVTTLAKIAEGLNTRNLPTQRGGKWSPVQVSRVMARLGM